jgi:tetratricopeptide (TPR) repeat protein
LLAAVAGVYFLVQNSRATVSPELATRVSEDPDRVYNEAQQAFEAGDWDSAIELLGAMLAMGRTSDDVQGLICDAYLQRGRAQVGSYSGKSDEASVEAAQKDFEAGLAICPDDPALSAHWDYAKGFLLALNAQESDDFDTVIQELAPVVADEPDYADDQARQLLYQGLVNRGDIRQRDGNLSGAFEDYEQALALDETDSLNAASRRDDLLRDLSGERPLATRQTDGTPTRTVPKYPAPTLLGPEDGALYRGEHTVILLQWEPVGELAPDEYYDVTVMHYVGEEPRYWGGPVRGTQWQVPVEAGLGEAANDRFYWWVTVRQAETAPGPDQLDVALSPRSDSRTLIWAE